MSFSVIQVVPKINFLNLTLDYFEAKALLKRREKSMKECI